MILCQHLLCLDNLQNKSSQQTSSFCVCTSYFVSDGAIVLLVPMLYAHRVPTKKADPSRYI